VNESARMTPAEWQRQHATVARLESAVAESEARARRYPFCEEFLNAMKGKP